MQASTDVVIVSWNCAELLARCVAALATATATSRCIASVLIVDNASRDACPDWPALVGLPFPLRIIRNSVNVGFAAGCNQGAREGRAEHVLFLNPDVEVHGGAIEASVAVLASDAGHRIGVVGIGLEDRLGSLQRTCAAFPTAGRMLGQAVGLDRIMPALVPPHFLSAEEHRVIEDVDQVMGAFWLMRRADFARVGGWDERFFLYMEDVDLALRLTREGQRSVYLREARASHIGGGTTRSIQDTRLVYLLRSRILYAQKHFGRFGCLVATATCLLVEPAARLVAAIIRLDRDAAATTLRATTALLRRFPFRTSADRGPL